MIPKMADNIEYARKEWLPFVEEHERMLVFPAFTRSDAVNLGLRICALGKEKYGSNVAVKVIMEGITVFSCFMDDTGLKNDWWMNCKYNTVKETGVSSMRALLDRVVIGKPLENWCKMPMSYFLCGGGFPIYLRSGEMKACVLVSALPHEEDHQLIADVLAEMLGVEIPSILAK